MPELLAHLVGDYVLQSHKMATEKTSNLLWAIVHAFFYTLPFLFLTQDLNALGVIFSTHALIDRYRIASRWCRWWGVGFRGVWVRSGDAFVEPPPFLGVWLVIIVDNTLHMTINHFALGGF